MGKKELIVELNQKIDSIPKNLKNFNLQLIKNGTQITYTYDTKSERTGITNLLNSIKNEGLILKDINTKKTSLESIFIKLVKNNKKWIFLV